jgi:methyl-accepting chemotaxis protein
MRPFLLRRRFLVRSFQYRLILHQAVYFFLLVAVAYWAGVEPLVSSIRDVEHSIVERERSAQALLYFHRNVMPFVVPLTLLLFAHSIVVSHRIAGPLYRFGSVLERLLAGDFSCRFKLRSKDYLQEEARQLDLLVARLGSVLGDVRRDARTLRATLEEGAGAGAAAAREAARALEARLADFVRVLPGDRAEGGSRSEHDRDAGGREAA